jgi:hypothetical protein
MKIDTTLRRWCGQCAAFTASVICRNGHNPVEICSDCPCPGCEDGETGPYRLRGAPRPA